MTALALPAAKLALGAAGSLVGGLASALDPAKAKARKHADDFETMFLEQMVERMTASSGTEGPLGENGTGGEIWRSQLNQQYAKQIQKAGGLGISDQVMRDLLRIQANSSATTNNGPANVPG